MSWKTTAAVLIVIVSVVIVQSLVADPLIQILDALAGQADSNVAGTGLDGASTIRGFAGDWLNMGLILIFGIMAWGVARVVRQELTQGRI